MKNFLIYILFFIISCVTVSLPIRANTFRGISMGEGLSDLLVNTIYKDSTGFVWLGTDNCLDRFDGINIKHYPFSGTDIKRKRVTSITETDSKYLWVGNGLGLWRLNRSTEEMERILPETIDCAVSSLYYDNRVGKLYIGTEKGLFIYDSGGVKQVALTDNILSASNHIVALSGGDNDIVWLLTTRELYSYNAITGEILTYNPDPDGQNPYLFRCITRIDNVLYLGTDNQGIIRFDISQHRFSRFTDVACNIISSISSNGKDVIYVSTDGNGVHFLSHLDGKIINSMRHDARDKSSIRSNSVYSLLVDKENIIWIGFYQAGFDYSLYQSGLFTVYSYLPDFDSLNMQVRSFLIHGNNKLVGTRDGLFYIDESRKLYKSFLIPALRANLILSINYYQNEYYIGTYGGGLSILNPVTLSVRDFAEGGTAATFQRGHIFCMEVDNEGNLWMGTSDGAYCYNKNRGELKQYTHTNSQLPEGNVYEIFFDSTRKGWICTENGMALYDSETRSIRTNVFPDGFVHKEKIRTIYEDSQHNLYFLPDKGSMLTSNLAMTSFYRTPMSPVLNGNAYMSIIEDNDGWIWLGCDDGLIRTRSDQGLYSVYNFSDGIPNPTFTNNAAYKDENGVLWFGNAKGLLYIDPHNVDAIRRNPYKIVLTDLQVNGNMSTIKERQEAMSESGIRLKHNQNNVVLNFINLSYTDPSTVVYEYKLDGLETEWKHIYGTNKVAYYDLPSGKYQFKIRVPGDEASEIDVNLIIRPMFSMWVWIFLLFAAIILYWIIYTRFIRIKKQIPPKASANQPVTVSEQFSTASSLSGNPESKITEEKYKTNRLTNEECKVILEKLTNYMQSEKPYTNPELKIADLARFIDTSSHSLSYLFNQYLNQSYYDYVNEYRIDEFKKLVNQSEYSRYTLSALAELCGFSSRASFFRSFKKITGITPNEYIRSIGGSNE